MNRRRGVLVVIAPECFILRSVAEVVAQSLTGAAFIVDIADSSHAPSPMSYGAVLLGSRAGPDGWDTGALSYGRRHRVLLSIMPTLLFEVADAGCLGTSGGDASRPGVDHRLDRLVYRICVAYPQHFSWMSHHAVADQPDELAQPVRAWSDRVRRDLEAYLPLPGLF